MQGCKEHALIAAENVFGAVAVMTVEVKDGDLRFPISDFGFGVAGLSRRRWRCCEVQKPMTRLCSA